VSGRPATEWPVGTRDRDWPGLPAGSTIYYRVDASNPFGTAKGSVQSFATAHARPPSVPST